jgi:hypothetical protein
MDKIKVNKISAKAKTHKGFSQGAFKGCWFCHCGEDRKGGACCRFGCDVDKETYDLIKENRKLIEAAIEMKIEDVFESVWKNDVEYLGGCYVRSKVRIENGHCLFHSVRGRECELVKLVLEKKLPWRLVPTICRVYPLAWERGELKMYDEIYAEIEKGCNCINEDNKTKETLFESQKDHIEDVFEMCLD